MAITGDVILASDKITFGKKTFALILVRQIEKQNLDDAAKVVDSGQTPSSARLYKTLIFRHASFVNGTTICGGDEDGRWMLAVFSKGQLSLAFFSGEGEPNLDPKRVEVSHDLCGTYSYVSRTADER